MRKSRQAHWQDVYTKKKENEVSWFQQRPALSVELIAAADAASSSAIIDIGGGASSLARQLVAVGYRDVSVLDISSAALEKAKGKIGTDAAKIEWIVADITEWQPQRRWDVWHDRAAFHFLTSLEDQEAYIRALNVAAASGAIAIISGFAPDGPEKCSGLPVVRYDAHSLAARLGSGFELLREEREEHRTPGGAVQKFYYAVLRKR